jgi:hypothetical protein
MRLLSQLLPQRLQLRQRPPPSDPAEITVAFGGDVPYAAVSAARIDVVTIANNHALDYGQVGPGGHAELGRRPRLRDLSA